VDLKCVVLPASSGQGSDSPSVQWELRVRRSSSSPAITSRISRPTPPPAVIRSPQAKRHRDTFGAPPPSQSPQTNVASPVARRRDARGSSSVRAEPVFSSSSSSLEQPCTPRGGGGGGASSSTDDTVSRMSNVSRSPSSSSSAMMPCTPRNSDELARGTEAVAGVSDESASDPSNTPVVAVRRPIIKKPSGSLAAAAATATATTSPRAQRFGRLYDSISPGGNPSWSMSADRLDRPQVSHLAMAESDEEEEPATDDAYDACNTSGSSMMADWSGYADVLTTSSDSDSSYDDHDGRRRRRRSTTRSRRRAASLPHHRRLGSVKEAAMKLDGLFGTASGGGGVGQPSHTGDSSGNPSTSRRIRPPSRWSETETDEGTGTELDDGRPY
jgi:hypothetical protein